MFKKVLSIALSAVLALGVFTSCGTAPAEKDAGKDEIKVGVIHIGDPAAGSGYSYAHDSGIVEMQKNLGLKDEQIVRKNNVDDTDEQAIETAINELIEAGCKIIFGTSWGYMDKMEAAAEANPEVIFSHCSGYKNNGKNFNNYFGQIYQARYLAGIAAGKKTKTNKIGYVAAQNSSNPEVTGGIDAFALGVKSVNADAKVYVKVTNTWFDLDKEKAAAVALLDKGCDVITQHQDTTQPMIAAQEKGMFGIGYNSDMAIEAPKAVLTSVVWHWGVYYTEAVKAVIDGTWKAENYFKGMPEGLLGLTDLTDLCDDETKAAVEKAQKDIVDGKLFVFDGEIKDNKGETHKDIDDAYIAGQINWYAENVEEI